MSLSNIPPAQVPPGEETDQLIWYVNHMEGVLWFITLTLKPSFLIFKESKQGLSALQQYKKSALFLDSIFRREAEEYVFIPELTKAGAVHWHGVLKPKNEYTIPILRDDVNISKCFGRSDFQILKSKSDIIKYLIKDYKVTYMVLNRKNISNPLDLIIWPSPTKKKDNKAKIDLSMFVVDRIKEGDQINNMFDDI